MVQKHTELGGQLIDQARRHGVSAAPEVSSDQRSTVVRLASLAGSAFESHSRRRSMQAMCKSSRCTGRGEPYRRPGAARPRPAPGGYVGADGGPGRSGGEGQAQERLVDRKRRTTAVTATPARRVEDGRGSSSRVQSASRCASRTVPVRSSTNGAQAVTALSVARAAPLRDGESSRRRDRSPSRRPACAHR